MATNPGMMAVGSQDERLMYGVKVHSRDNIGQSVRLVCNGWYQIIPENIYRNMMYDTGMMQRVCRDLRERADEEERRRYSSMALPATPPWIPIQPPKSQESRKAKINKKLLLLLP